MGGVAPVSPRERIAILDVLRGCALWGVLIGNTMWIYSSRWYIPDTATSSLDLPAVWFVTLFVNGKAMTLLTFMFGLGFALQLVRAEEHGTSVRGLFVRRMLALIALGWLHVLVLWWGDVTWGYALTGLTLLAFGGVRDRWLIVWALALTFVPEIILALPQVETWFWGLMPDRGAFNDYYVDSMRHGSFLTVMYAHAQQAFVHMTPGFLQFWPWQIGRFLVGLLAGRHHIFDDNGATHMRFWKRAFAIALVTALLGIAHKVVAHYLFWTKSARYVLTGLGGVANTIADELGTLAMVAFYISSTVLLFRYRWTRRILMWLAPAGRMPLTNYYLHSVIMTTIFYGRGFGMAGKLSFAACLGLCFAVYPAIVVIAHLWLRHFRFGPAEWLWRTLAYGTSQRMRDGQI